MAVHKVKRSKITTQPRPQPAKSARPGDPIPALQSPETPNQASLRDPQLKSELFSTLARLNRGYGIAVAALDRLRKQDRRQRPSAFPAACLNNFRDQTEELRATANRDLLRLLATREQHDAERFSRFATANRLP